MILPPDFSDQAVQALDRMFPFPNPPRSHSPAPTPRARRMPRRKVYSRFREAVPDYRTHLAVGDWTRVDPTAESIFQRWAERWSNRVLCSITCDDLRSYLLELPLLGQTSREVEKERVLLRSFFRWAMRAGWTDSNPAEDLERVRLPGESAASPLPPVHQFALLEACRGRFPSRLSLSRSRTDEGEAERSSGSLPVPRYLYPIVLLALRTGLRLADILNLSWRHVDLKARWISIPASESSTGRAIDVPICGDARAALAHILAELPDEPVAERRVLDAVGLPLWKGKPDEREVLHTFRVIRKKAGIHHGDCHSLRLTFLQNCARAGVPREDAARMCDWDGDSDLLDSIYHGGKTRLCG